MPCPFCDDGTVYADMAPPATSLPLAGFARSRPALAKQNSGPGAFSNDPRPAPAQVSVAEPVAAAPAPEPQPGGASIGNQILAALALLLVGGIALPRLSPALGNLLNRASDKPRPAGPVPQDVLADDKAFSAFVVALQNPVANEAKLPLPATSETRAKPQLSPAEQLERYFETAPNLLASMRAGVSEFCHVQTDRQRQEILAQLAERITTLRGLADPPELLPIRQLALGVQGLLKQLAEKPSEVTPSNLRTAAGALVLLESISSANLKADIATNPPVRLLVVDDDAVSRLAVALALKKAFPQPDVASDGEAALALAKKQAYDVIFLDVEMPGMDGYELCTRIHETALNHSTPVIFVTRHGDFDSRAKSTRSGAQDLIAKPFLSFEITLKALTFVIRERLKPAQEGAPSATAREREGKEMLQPGADFHKSFFACAPTHLEFLREQLRALTSAGTDGSREESLGNLYTSAQSFAAEAERAELRAVARLGCALVTLLKKIIEKPEQLANSNLEALAATLDLLEELCAESLNPSLSDPEVRTLIVDDDPIVLRVLSSAVQAACSKPETVANGDEAAARAAEQEFDLILLDVDLPGVDGFKTCRRIHNTARNRSTPVIFVTGFGDQESRRKAVGLGCRGFIVKPAIASEITLRTLTFAVRARLEKLRHPRSAARQPEPVLA
jgi:CheY-like chemotaxis protein